MLYAMLVDDEPLALEGLKLLIDWQAEGFAICCECASGHEALEKIPLYKPDLIVTDIRMPGMSGLDLLKACQNAGFTGQFVIVSGYSDFSYAKKALQLGVAGYLLKPVEPADAAEVLSHVRQKLIRRETSINLQSEAIKHAITVLLMDSQAVSDDIPTAKRWILATWGAPLPNAVLQSLLAGFTDCSCSAHIIEDKEYLVFRLQANEPLPDMEEMKSFLAGNHRHLTLSEFTNSPYALYALRQQLSDQLNTTCRSALPGFIETLVHTIALRQTAECMARCTELEHFCASCGAAAITSARRQLISACAGLLSERANAIDILLCSQDTDLQTLCLLAIKLLAPEQERISDLVEHYTREHSSKPITISSIAAALGYNPTYLGRKFCEERGIGFREWLIQLRMEQSVALLRNSNRSINAIAKAVGYEHYKRFLLHFKRQYGMPPEQYRRHIKQSAAVNRPLGKC